jgi:hypothetical protein
MSVARTNQWLNRVGKDFLLYEALAGPLDPFVVAPSGEQAAYLRSVGGDSQVISFVRPKFSSVLHLKPRHVSDDYFQEFFEAVFLPEAVHERYKGTPKVGLPPAEGACQAWVMAGVMAEGVKLFVPTQREFEALASVEPRVPLSMYRHPFPTFLFVIPPEVYPEPLTEDYGRPVCAAVRFKQSGERGGILSCAIPGDSGREVYLSWRMAWSDTEESDEETLDAKLARLDATNPPDFGGFGRLAAITDDSENVACEQIKRAVVNAALLLTDNGHRVIGYQNPEHREKCLAKAKLKRLPQHIRDENARQARSVPLLFGFDQHTRVYEEHAEPGRESGSTGEHVRPHWRRGHWHTVVCGKDRAERRKKYYPAVLVNDHLLGGPLSGTRVTMTTS